MAGVYVHIPFCRQACHYCDFHFSTNLDIRAALVDALIKEVALRRHYLGNEQIETIYFGGGTPSVLSANEINRLIELLRNTFTVSSDAEITLEGNPDDLTKQKLEELRAAGINRLSIGVQSFSNELLQMLNRVHDSHMSVQSVKHAREVGFSNLNLDLIYAIPGQSVEMLESDLSQLLQLEPEHISCYGLTIEEKTVFGKWSKSGKFREVSDETNAEHFELVMSTLSNAGYDHYEISNFSKPGLMSRHNSSYWKQQKYLGLGPSAHSYSGDTRQFNVSNNHTYVRCLNDGTDYFELETLTREDKINEFLLTGLRTSWGCDLERLRDELTYDILADQSDYLRRLQQAQLIEIQHDIMRLTHKGKFVADSLLAEMVLVNSEKNEG